jgi:hypothetical protein
MTYTTKMHVTARRQAGQKKTIVTDLLDEIERLQKENEEMRKVEAADFWSNWVYPNGANPKQIQNELVDYYIILENVCKVYDHITGGRISKPNTFAYAVIGEADEYYARLELENKEDEEIHSEQS